MIVDYKPTTIMSRYIYKLLLLHQVWPMRLTHNGLVCAPGGCATLMILQDSEYWLKNKK